MRIALPNKGRLTEDIKHLFDEAGLPIRGKSERSLTARLGDAFEAIFVRAQDIPGFVAEGAADAGITGLDLMNESECALLELLDLGFGRCRLVVAAREESRIRTLDDLPNKARIATSFTKITSRFFAERGRAVQVVAVSGAAEITPHLGVADIVVDLTSTGSTLRTNGLREVATIMESSARLITRLSEDKNSALRDLTTALDSVIRARSQRYLMANVPKDKLDAVRTTIPGLRAPTILNMMGAETYVAMHAVVPAASVYKVVAHLKDLGCEGILVTRIERLML